jgi:serine protease inhibitor ecotin
MTGSRARAIARLVKSAVSRDNTEPVTADPSPSASGRHPRLRGPRAHTRLVPSLAIAVLILGLFPGTVAAAAATHLVVDAPPSASVGSEASVTVTAKDGDGATDTTYGGTAVITSSDPAASFPTTLDFLGGIATFDVTFSAAGSQTVTARDDSLTVPVGISGPITVGAGAQAITFGTAPTGVVVGGTGKAVSATGGASGNPVTFSSTTPLVCSVNASTGALTLIASGTCTIAADQAGNANWLAAPPVTQDVTVGAGAQAITFGTAPTGVVVGGTGKAVSATGGASGNPVTFSSTTPLVCSVNASTGALTLIASGTCTIAADQAGNANWLAAPPVTQDVTVGAGAQATLTITGPSSATFGAADATFTTTGGSGTGATTFDAGSSTACSIVAGQLHIITGTGTCSVTATKAADTNYNATTSVAFTISINKAAQLTLTITAPTNATFGAADATFTTTGGSGTGATTFDAGSSTACSIVVGKLHVLTSTGSCVVTATKAADANYNATTSAAFTISIGKADQATLTITAPSSLTYGDADAAFTTTGGSSTGGVTYDAGASTACSIVGVKLHIISATGTCVVTATKAADADYNATTSAPFTISIAKAALDVTASSPTPGVYGDAVPAVSPQYGSFVLGENATNLTAAPTCSVAYTQGDAAGDYATSCSGGVSDNYAFNYISGNFHVAIRAITVTANSGQAKAHSAADPIFTYTVTSGSLFGTDAFSGALSRVAGEAVGTYAITVGTLTAGSNYSLSFVSATFSITGGATYHALTPARLLDGRNGTGLGGPFSSHAARTFQVTGIGGVPTNATAVTGNLTVTGQTGAGYLYVGPVATNNPTSSTLNFPVGDDRANGVTVALGVGGTLSVTYVGPNSSAYAYAVFDVTGYFTPDTTGATYFPLTPARLLDTRNGTGLVGAFSSHAASTFQVTGRGGVPGNATAVTGNLTVTSQTGAGYLYIGPVATNNPTSSTLNFPLGDNRANGVTVALGAGGTLSVTFVASASAAATAHVIFDVTGYFTPDTTGATYFPLDPTRLLDTRNGTGLGGPFSSHVARAFQVTGRGGVPATATGVTGNLTVTSQTGAGYLYVGPVATNNPTSSTLNFPVGDDRANGVTVALGAGGILGVTYVGPIASSTTHVVFDVTGYFLP